MIGKKAQQNSKLGAWPQSASPPSSRKSSGESHSDHATPIVVAASTSLASTETFESAAGSPARSKTRSVANSIPKTIPSEFSVKESKRKGKERARSSDSTKSDVEDASTVVSTEPVLPMTPKSPDARSPTVAPTTIRTDDGASSAAVPLSTTVNAEDMAVVQDLLGTMKEMLSTLGNTFDTIGEQTVKIATLPAAMNAVHQIASVRHQLEDQHKRQEERMQDMKTLLMEQVRTKLYGRLRETASGIVKDMVQREIAARVRQQLAEQIPQKLRDDVIRYKRQIQEVKISLHNSEARRHNALIRSNSLNEPLMPLLRPPPVPRSDWPLSVSIPAGSAHGGSASAYADKAPAALPMTTRVFSESDAIHPTPATAQGRRARLPRLDIEPPTPSPLFPRDLTSLIRLGPEEAKALMEDYGLVRVRYPTTLLPPIIGEDEEDVEQKPEVFAEEPVVEESREESINRFLSYIGVGFQLVPTSPTPGSLGPGAQHSVPNAR